jgi:transcriptional regulator with XRE-family HTH domain
MFRSRLWIWEQDECLALCKAMAEYNESRPKELRITQCHVASELGISPAAANAYFRGKRALNIAVAQAVLKLTGIQVDKFSPRLADDIRLKHGGNS